jgi:hypothetical protein
MDITSSFRSVALKEKKKECKTRNKKEPNVIFAVLLTFGSASKHYQRIYPPGVILAHGPSGFIVFR